MKIHFLGAAQTVTGSCYIIEACSIRFAIDCGMHQGNSAIEERNYSTKHYHAEAIDFVLLTHAHMDHSGLLPRIVADGFKNPIYCTPPTVDLVSLMLEDSAHIQETEAEWKRKKQSRRSGKSEEILPLYTMEDAQKTAEFLSPIEYDTSFEPAKGIKVTYRDAGHILGAAFLELIITENDTVSRLIFSGDLGRPGTLLMHNAEEPHATDYLFLESTYGNRNHRNEELTLDELAEAIAYSHAKNEKIIIPAFAVGRTQEILFCLAQLNKQKRLPANIPIYVDSPLAIRTTKIFKKYMDYLNIPEKEQDLAHVLPTLKFTLSVVESQAINAMKGSAIVIAASGMCNAGRVKHHLRHNAWRPGASIVFVGYQGMGTPGRRIVDGAQSIRIFNEDVVIKAKIFTINGFSAHAGQSQLLDWMSHIVHPNLQTILVHGEYESQKILANLITERFKLPVVIPNYLDEMTLTPTNQELIVTESSSDMQNVNWNILIEDADQKMTRIKALIENANSMPWSRQIDLRDRVLELNKELLSVLAQF